MGRWEPLVLHADSRAARINLDRRGQFSNVIHISARRFAYPDSTSSSLGKDRLSKKVALGELHI